MVCSRTSTFNSRCDISVQTAGKVENEENRTVAITLGNSNNRGESFAKVTIVSHFDFRVIDEIRR